MQVNSKLMCSKQKYVNIMKFIGKCNLIAKSD